MDHVHEFVLGEWTLRDCGLDSALSQPHFNSRKREGKKPHYASTIRARRRKKLCRYANFQIVATFKYRVRMLSIISDLGNTASRG